jgi:protein transport protein SEC61 subunit gamma-like protein
MQDSDKPSLIFKIKRFIIECSRVLRVTKKPNSFEFKTIVKVAGLGIIVIGLIGFLIQMIRVLFIK